LKKDANESIIKQLEMLIPWEGDFALSTARTTGTNELLNVDFLWESDQ
jgi:hypothetical protein